MLSLRLLNKPGSFTSPRNLSQAIVRLCHKNAAAEAETSKAFTVYDGDFTARLRLLKFVALGTSAFTLCCQPMMAKKILLKFPGALGITLSLTLAGISVISPLFLHIVTKGYVTRLRFAPDKRRFEAHTLDLLGRTRSTEFTQSDVAFPEYMGPMTTLTIKNESRLIDFEKITDPEAFNHLMKYDQPVDLMLEEFSNDRDK